MFFAIDLCMFKVFEVLIYINLKLNMKKRKANENILKINSNLSDFMLMLDVYLWKQNI